MPRSVNSVASRTRRKKMMKLAKGYFGRRKNVWTVAKNAVEKGLVYAYRDRKTKKRNFRRLWITRINAAARLEGLSYSQFMGAMKAKGIDLNRKVLADLAMNHPEAFKSIVNEVRGSVPKPNNEKKTIEPAFKAVFSDAAVAPAATIVSAPPVVEEIVEEVAAPVVEEVVEEVATPVVEETTADVSNSLNAESTEETTETSSLFSSIADDLKKVEGIGPKIAELLNNAGIFTFSQLAITEVDRIKQVLEEAGSRYTMHDPTTWPKQAEMAAAGKWEELEKWQDELDGGKIVE